MIEINFTSGEETIIDVGQRGIETTEQKGHEVGERRTASPRRENHEMGKRFPACRGSFTARIRARGRGPKFVPVDGTGPGAAQRDRQALQVGQDQLMS